LENDLSYNECLEILNEDISLWYKIIDNKKDNIIIWERKYKDTGLYILRIKSFFKDVVYTTTGDCITDI
jgi:hypothetical protein